MKRNSTRFIVGLLGIVLFAATTMINAQTWQVQTSGTTVDLRHVHFVSATTGWVVGHSGTVLKTTDGGTNWTKMPFDATYATLIGCYFVNEKRGWVGGDVGVYKTDDGGSTWIYQAGPSGITKLYFVDANTGWAVGGSDGGASNYGDIYKTSDGGQTWDKTTNNTTWTRFYGIQFVDQFTGWAYAEGNGLLVGTTDGGKNWNTLQNNSTNLIRGFYFKDKNTGWFSGRSSTSGLSMKSTDGGASWNNIAGQLNFGLASIQMVNDQTGWVTSGPAIMKTVDSGVTWTSDYVGASSFGSSSMYFFDSNHGWAVGEAGKIVAYNNGNTGFNATPSADKNLNVSVIQSSNEINITCKVKINGKVQNNLLDISGRNIAGIINADLQSGNYNFKFSSQNLSTGIYLLRLMQASGSETLRILIQ